MASDNS